jgi:DNA-binding MarR family transcriptional regulator
VAPEVPDRHAGKQATRRSAAGEAFNDVLLKVLSLNGRFTSAGEALTRPAGQTLARWVVLAEAKDSPSPVSDIARRLRLARQSVQRIADVLVHDGLSVYKDNPHHQRAKLLELTPLGRSALTRIEAAQREWADELGEQIGEKVLHRASSALAAIAVVLDEAEST